MVLPSGVNKGSGLQAALRELDCPSTRRWASETARTTLVPRPLRVPRGGSQRGRRRQGEGRLHHALRGRCRCIQLIDELIATDFSQRVTGGVGDVVVLRTGATASGDVPALRPEHPRFWSFGRGQVDVRHGPDRAPDRSRLPICIVDPEGDYGTLDGIVTMGNRLRPPHVDEVLDRLSHGRADVVVNLLGIALDDRPDFFAQLFPRLQALRARTGGPDWILIDEVHHLLPTQWGQATYMLPQRLGETILITHRPSEVAPAILAMMDTAVAVGPSPALTLGELARRSDSNRLPFHRPSATRRSSGAKRGAGSLRRDHRSRASARPRHLRKYAEGNLGPRNFFFRGAAARMNLRAQNLTVFCELASGIDDDTWLFHLRRGDYSAWLAGRSRTRPGGRGRRRGAGGRARAGGKPTSGP